MHNTSNGWKPRGNKSENCLNKMAICTFDYCSHSTDKKKGKKKKGVCYKPFAHKNKNNEKSYADSQNCVIKCPVTE